MTLRSCAMCKAPIDTFARADKVTCSGTCTTAWYRWRKKKDELCAFNRERVDEIGSMGETEMQMLYMMDCLKLLRSQIGAAINQLESRAAQVRLAQD